MMMRYHFITIRLFIIKKKEKRNGGGIVLARMCTNWNAHTLLVKMYTTAATVETVWWFLEKLNANLPYDPAFTFLGI